MCPRPAKPVAAAHNARLVSSSETPTCAAFRVATRGLRERDQRDAVCGDEQLVEGRRRGLARATVAEQLVDDRVRLVVTRGARVGGSR